LYACYPPDAAPADLSEFRCAVHSFASNCLPTIVASPDDVVDRTAIEATLTAKNPGTFTSPGPIAVTGGTLLDAAGTPVAPFDVDADPIPSLDPGQSRHHDRPEAERIAAVDRPQLVLAYAVPGQPIQRVPCVTQMAFSS
jgi:hypothetical protein